MENYGKQMEQRQERLNLITPILLLRLTLFLHLYPIKIKSTFNPIIIQCGLQTEQIQGRLFLVTLIQDLIMGIIFRILLTSYSGFLYFVGNDGISGLELWKTDGTPAGTTLVKDIYAGASSAFDIDYGTGFFTKVNNIFYFLARDAANGIELWKSDGTTDGTMIVKDITLANSSTVISSLTQVGNKLAFLVYDNTTQKKVLWQSDGTDAGTTPVNDLNLTDVTINDFFSNALVGYKNQLFFTAYTQEYGNELWTGTLNNVLPIQLLRFTGKLINNRDAQLNWTTENEQSFDYFNLQRSIDGIHFSTVAKLTAKGNSGLQTDYQYTDKNIVALFAKNIYYRLEEIDKEGKSSLSSIALIQLNNHDVNISIQPNPVRSNFKIHIDNLDGIQQAQMQIINTHGSQIINEKRNLNSGNNLLTYNAHSWSAGVYVVRVMLSNGIKKELKIIKQ